MKKTTLYILGILISTFIFWSMYADEPSDELECKYAGDFERCVVANKNNSARSIDDFVCLQSDDKEKILDQIILDVNFREIDEEVIEYLEKLQKDKDKYFGPNADDWVNRAIDDITKNFWGEGVYYEKYRKLCDGWILGERMSCGEKLPIIAAWLRLKWSNSNAACMNLVNFKLDTFTNTAYIILQLNKSSVLADQHKKYVKEERTKYDALLDMMQTIIGYTWRLARWVTHWTPYPKQ